MPGLTLAGIVVLSFFGYIVVGITLYSISKYFFHYNDPEMGIFFMIWPLSFPMLLGFVIFSKAFRIIDEFFHKKALKRLEKWKPPKLEDEIITSKNYHKIKSLIAEYEKNLPVMERG